MARRHFTRVTISMFAIFLVTACGNGGLGLFGNESPKNIASSEDVSAAAALETSATTPPPAQIAGGYIAPRGGLFGQKKLDPNITIQVNKYIWSAALDVLNFLPVQSADPFTGVIITGYGTPPGGGRSYRATIYVQDPALDARSLRVALLTKNGPANAETVRAVEDAILTRARQLHGGDAKL